MYWKQTRKALFTILLHPAFLALPLASALIFLVPGYFRKYTGFVDHEKVLTRGSNFEYYDLDHDGSSEWYVAGDNTLGGSALALHNRLGVAFHWDFHGSYIPGIYKCMIGDCDNDGADEIYTFTESGDSLLLNSIDFRKPGKFIRSDRCLTTIRRNNGNIDFDFRPLKVTDLTGDGYKELVFAVSTGYGVNPRRVFAYDVRNDSVFASPELGGHIVAFDMADVDGDGLDEIAVSNYAPGNMKDTSLPMQDTNAYVIALNNNLQFLFLPKVSPGRYNGINNRFIRHGNSYFIASYWDYNSQQPGKPALRIYDLKGNLVAEKVFSDDYRTRFVSIYTVPDNKGNDRILFSPMFDEIEVFDANLTLLKSISIKRGDTDIEQFDFDLDGEKELFFRSANPDEWIILRRSLRNPVFIKTHITAEAPLLFNINRKGKPPLACIQLDNHQYTVQYGFNKLFYWQIPLHSSIYLASFLFIVLIRHLTKVQMKRKYESEKRLVELQLSSLHNQMDSHFTFNVLNTIGAAIVQEHKDTAYNLLAKFSRLVRRTLADSESVTRTLESELQLVRDFLDIQRSRFEGVFDYEIISSGSINSRQLIPKGCIYTYVENAIKHGLVPRERGGKLTISVSSKENYTELVINDNGIGRRAADNTANPPSGFGLRIMRQYYELLNKTNTEPITETITDLSDDQGRSIGTRVTIKVPSNFVFTEEVKTGNA